jgi:hypothetical protein
MASYHFDPINILDTSNATGVGSGGSLTLGGGISVGRDTFIGGNLNVSGTNTTFVDNLIVLNANPTASYDTGFLLQRYQTDVSNNDNYSGIVYSETVDEFIFGYATSDVRGTISLNRCVPIRTAGVNITGGSLNATFHSNTIGSIITTGGNVGINTTAPSFKLDVQGDIQLSGNFYKNGDVYSPGSQWTSFSNNIAFTSGNIGIGTTNPNSTLDVAGSAQITNLASTTSTIGALLNTNVISTNITAATLNATGITTANSQITNLSSTISTIGTLLNTNLVSTNVSSATLTLSSGITTPSAQLTNANVTTSTIGALLNTNVISTNITAATLNATGITTANSQITNLSSTISTIGTLLNTNLVSTNVSSATLTLSSGITTPSAQITNANVTTSTIGTLLNTNAISSNVSSATLTLSTGITAPSAQITNANVTTSTIATLRNTNILSTNVSSATLRLSTGITSPTAQITDAVFTNVTSATLYLYSGLTSESAQITNVRATNITTSNLNATSLVLTNAATMGTIRMAGSLYAHIIYHPTFTLGNNYITISYGNFTSLSTGSLNVSSNLTSTNISSATLTLSTGITAPSAQITNANATTATIGTLLNTNTVSTNVTVSSALISTLGSSWISSTVITGGSISLSGNMNVAGNAVIAGDLTVAGTTTTINTNTTLIEDNLIVLNSGPNGLYDGGIMVQRTAGSFAALFYSASNDEFQIVQTASDPGTSPVVVSAYKNLRLGNIVSTGDSNTIGSLITTGGNVGIGTTSPTVKLQVKGNSYFEDNVTIGSLFCNNAVTQSITTQMGSFFSNAFTASNNVVLSTDVTGLSFNNTLVRSFVATVTVIVNKSVGGNLYETFTLEGHRTDSDWSLLTSSFGDVSGLSFSITSTGQVQYTSISHSNWLNTTIRYTASQINENGVYTNVVSATSGTISIDSLQLNNTASNSLYSNGGATFQKSVIVANTSTSLGIGSGGSLTLLGGAAISKNIHIGNDAYILGNMGVNTTSPSQRLHVNGIYTNALNSTTGYLELSQGWQENAGYVSFHQPDGTRKGYIGYGVNSEAFLLWGEGSRSIVIGSNSTTRITVTSAGNVGIGTVNPSQNLHVEGQAVITTSISTGAVLATAITTASAQISNANVTTATVGTLLNTNVVSTNVSSSTLVASTGITTASAQISNLASTTSTIASLVNTNFNSTNMTVSNARITSTLSATGTSNTIGSIITTSGNVGIGNATPAYTLDIIGSGLHLGDSSYGGFTLEYSGNNVSGCPDFYNLSAKPSYVSGGGSGPFIPFITLVNTYPRNRVDIALAPSGGSVGIGTTTPGVGAGGSVSNAILTLRNGVYGGNNGTSTILIGGNSNHFSSITSEHTGNGLTYLSFGTASSPTNPTEKMRITAAGNVGIATSDPSFTLDVSGTARFTTGITTANVEITGLTDTLNLTATNATIAILNLSTGLTTATAQITNANVTTSTIGTLRSTNEITTNISSATLNLSTGLTTASAQIGTANVTTSIIAVGNSNTIGSIFTTGGNVGIGTALPSFNLDIHGSTAFDASTTLRLYNNASQYGRTQIRIIGRYEAMNDAWSVDPRNAIMFQQQTAQAGTITTKYILQNFGEQFGILNGAGTPLMVWNSTGNIGIGMSSPSYTLDVTGAARITAGITTANVEVTGLTDTLNLTATNATIAILNLSTGLTTASAQITNANVTNSTISTLRSTNEITTNISSATLNVSTGITTASAEITNANVTNSTIGTLRSTNVSTTNISTVSVVLTGDISMENSKTMLAKNATGSYETFLWPRWSDNIMYLNFASNGFHIRNQASNTVMFMTSTGNVGIGISNPSYTLDVTGTARITTGITTGGLEVTGSGLVDTPNLTVTTAATISSLNVTTFNPTNVSTTNITATSLLATNANTTNITVTSLLATNITSAGVIRFGNNATSGISFGNNFSRIYDDGQLRLYTDDNMYFYTTNTTSSRIYINPSGNVGIGTESLSSIAKLHVHGQDSSLSSGSHMTFTTSTDSFPTMQLFNYSHDTAALLFDAYYDSSAVLRISHTTGFAIYKSNNALTIGAAMGSAGAAVTTENAITINTGGSLGMGTSTPGEKLDIRGNLRVGNSTSANYISFHGTNGDSPGNWNHTYIGERIYSAGSELSELLLFKGNDNIPWAGPDRIRLLSAEHRFDIYSSALSGSFDTVGASGTTRMIVNNNGLSLYGDFTNYLNNTTGYLEISPGWQENSGFIAFHQADGNRKGYIGYGTTTESFLLWGEGARKIVLGTNSASRITVTSAGNVGIGTDSPTFLLDVNGTARISTSLTTGGLEITGSGVVDTPNLTVTTAATVSSLRLTNSINIGGNIGIGTTSPSVDLHISRSNTVASLFIDQFNSNGIGTGRAAFQSWNVNNSRSSLAIGSNVFLDQSATIRGYNFTTGSTYPVGWSILMGNYYDSLFVTRHASVDNILLTLTSNGSMSITGSLSKASGTFDIIHPNDDTKKLVHSFIEGPRCDLIYRGQVQLNNGQATVDLDADCVAESDCAMTTGTFESLCANPQYFLQNHTSFSRVKGTINGAILTIECENVNSTDTIYWSVIAERKDQHIKSWERTNANGYLVTEYNNSQ